MTSPFDARPIVVALAGPNGAGKTTFYGAHLAQTGLRFVNADDLARELEVDAYEATEVAKNVRDALVEQRESFVFETVSRTPSATSSSSFAGQPRPGTPSCCASSGSSRRS